MCPKLNRNQTFFNRCTFSWTLAVKAKSILDLQLHVTGYLTIIYSRIVERISMLEGGTSSIFLLISEIHDNPFPGVYMY